MTTDEQLTDPLKVVSEEQKAAWQSEQVRLKALLIAKDDVDFGTPTSPLASIGVTAEKEFPGLSLVAGADISFQKDGSRNEAVSSLVVLKFPSLEVVYEDFAIVKLELPYIAGYLAFRETPAIRDLIENLRKNRPDLRPQVLFVDGNGTFHPLGFGSACHLGVIADVPTIGVSKNFLEMDDLTMKSVKDRCREQLSKTGDRLILRSGGIDGTGPELGAAVISAKGVTNPIYVSVGHRLCLESAIQLTLRCCQHRIPEPIRQADLRSRNIVRECLDKDELEIN